MQRDGRLVEFSFSSRLAPDLSANDLIQLARQIWRDNTRAGLTGLLRRRGAEVDQIVEGPSALILPLSARILTDRRHGEIVIRIFAPSAHRAHTGWAVEGFEQPAGHMLDFTASGVNLRRLPVASRACVRTPAAIAPPGSGRTPAAT